jgi:diguanylate cyclase (GGDEF)-like protein
LSARAGRHYEVLTVLFRRQVLGETAVYRIGFLLGLILAAAAANSVCLPEPARIKLRAAAEAIPAETAALSPAWQTALNAARACQQEQASPANEAALIEILLQGATTWQRGGDPDAAYRLVQELRTLTQTPALARQHYRALTMAAELDVRAGRVEDAARDLQEVLNLSKAQGWHKEQAEALSDLSTLERRRSNYFDALAFERQALNLRRSMQPPSETWRSLSSLAVLYEQIELLDLSRANYLAALDAAATLGGVRDVADARLRYADFLNDFGAGESHLALSLAEQALPVYRDTDPVRQASALLQIGRARMQLGQMDGALSAFQEAHALATRNNAKSMLAHTQFRWGEYEFNKGNFLAALGRIEQARVAYIELENRHRLIKVSALLERVYLALGRELDAARSGREHFRLRNEVLGAGATQKLSELLGDFELSEERLRNTELKAANEVSATKLSAERRVRVLSFALVGFLVLGLAVLAFRHTQVKRLNQRLRLQQQDLTRAHAELMDKSAELYHATITDSLTGLSNRRFGMAQLAQKLAAPRRASIAVLLMDLDHFKSINDQHGHPVGDQVLLAVTAALSTALPEVLLSRIGGEEFLAVIEDRSPEQCWHLAETARAAVCAKPVPTEHGELLITISIGIRFLDPHTEASLSQVLTVADQALYLAKSAGRNCVKFAGSDGKELHTKFYIRQLSNS